MKNYRYLLFMLFGASFAFNPAHASDQVRAADQKELDSNFLMVLQDAVGLQAEQANQDDFLDFSDEIDGEIDCNTPPTTATTEDLNTATISQSDLLKILLEAQFNQTLQEEHTQQNLDAVLEQAATSDKAQQKKPGLKRKKQGKPTTNKKNDHPKTDRLEKAELPTSSNTNTVTQQTSAAVVASVSSRKNPISFKTLSKQDGKKPFKCTFDGCSADFALKGSLTKHTRTHTGEKPFKCLVEGCGAAFSISCNLTAHRRIHTGEKPFKCTFEGCSNAFSEVGALNTHTKIHTGEKPFKCTFNGCGADFALKSSLTKHTRTHTGEKPFKCLVKGCGAAFSISCNLTTHTRTHTGEKPFKCTFKGCSAAFAQSGNLNTHTRTHTRALELPNKGSNV